MNVCLNEQPLPFANCIEWSNQYSCGGGIVCVTSSEREGLRRRLDFDPGWSPWRLSDERLPKVPNYGVNVHHRKAIVRFVGKKSDVFVNLSTGYGKSNGGFKGRDSLYELSSETRSEYEFEFDCVSVFLRLAVRSGLWWRRCAVRAICLAY